MVKNDTWCYKYQQSNRVIKPSNNKKEEIKVKRQNLKIFSKMDFMSPFWWLEIHPDPRFISLNPLSANITKRSNKLKQFVGKLPTNCLSVFDHFVGLALKRVKIYVSDNRSRAITGELNKTLSPIFAHIPYTPMKSMIN